MPQEGRKALVFAALTVSVAVVGSAAETDEIIRLSRIADRNQVFHILTTDADVRYLGLSRQEWQTFARGSDSVYRRAFDPGTQDAVELLPGLARLQAISSLEDLPYHRMVESYRTGLTPRSRNLIETIQWAEILYGLASGWVNPLAVVDQLATGLAESEAVNLGPNYLYREYERLRLQNHTKEQAWSRLAGRLGGPMVPAYRATRSAFLSAVQRIGGPTHAQQVDGAVADYLELRFKGGGRYPMAWVAEDIFRRELRREKRMRVQELARAARNRIEVARRREIQRASGRQPRTGEPGRQQGQSESSRTCAIRAYPDPQHGGAGMVTIYVQQTGDRMTLHMLVGEMFRSDAEARRVRQIRTQMATTFDGLGSAREAAERRCADWRSGRL